VTPRLLLATANAGKVRELVLLLDGLGYTLTSLRDHPGAHLPPEGETSYRDNALEKARAEALKWVDSLRDTDEMVVVLAGGRIVETGTLDELIARNGEFVRLFDAQLGQRRRPRRLSAPLPPPSARHRVA